MRKLIALTFLVCVAWASCWATVASFPDEGYLEDAARTNLEMKSALEDFLAATKQLLGAAEYDAGTELTINSGAVTAVRAYHTIDTEGDAASDYLDNLGIDPNTLPQGSIVLIRPASSSRTVIVNNEAGGSGEIYLVQGVDFSMTDTDMFLMLCRVANDWYEVCRSWGQGNVSTFQTTWRLLDNEDPTWTDKGTGYRLELESAQSLSLSSTTHALTSGLSSGANIAFDHSRIQARDGAGGSAALVLNPLGGGLYGGGATSDYTIWTKANDGASSGLDADTFDGIENDRYLDNGYNLVCQRMTSGSNGGTATATTWTMVSMTVELEDTRSLGLLSGGRLRLPAGTYRCRARLQMLGVGAFRARIYNYSTSTALLYGTNGYSDWDNLQDPDGGEIVYGISEVNGYFTIYGFNYIELDYYCAGNAGGNNYALGNAASLDGTYEYYSTIEFWKMDES